jgi:hypothetical protein
MRPVGSSPPAQAGGAAIKGRAFTAAMTAIVILYLILFAWYFAATMIRRPYWDMFHYVLDYLGYPQQGGFLDYLWSQYTNSEHRQIWMRLMTAIDVGALRGTAYPFLVFASACVVGLALITAREIARAGLAAPLRQIGIFFVILLAFSTATVVDCSVAIEGIYPQTAAFATLTLTFAAAAGEGGPRAWQCWTGAIAAAIGAGLACTLGLLVWPILLWAAWRSMADWRWIAALALAASAFIALYLHGLHFSGEAAAALQGNAVFYASDHLRQTGDAFLTFLGLPWSRAPSLWLAGRIIGALLLVLSIAVLLRRGFLLSPRAGAQGRLERFCLGLIAFSLATAAVAAIGRASVETEGILPVRYSVLMTPLHIGLLGLALIWLSERNLLAGQWRWVRPATIGLGLVFLVQQVAAGQAEATKAAIMNASIADFMAGKRDAAMTHIVYHDLDYAQQAVDEMRRRGLFPGLI